MLPVFSFNDSIQMVLPLKEFTLRWYQSIADHPALLVALGNSFKVAVPVLLMLNHAFNIEVYATTGGAGKNHSKQRRHSKLPLASFAFSLTPG